MSQNNYHHNTIAIVKNIQEYFVFINSDNKLILSNSLKEGLACDDYTIFSKGFNDEIGNTCKTPHSKLSISENYIDRITCKSVLSIENNFVVQCGECIMLIMEYMRDINIENIISITNIKSIFTLNDSKSFGILTTDNQILKCMINNSGSSTHF